MFYRLFSYLSLILVVVLSLNAQIHSLECLWNLWNTQLFLTILAANIHKEIRIESVATSFYFHLALMLESILFAKIFFLYLLLGPCLCSLFTFFLCFFLYHIKSNLSGSLLKLFAACLCLPPYLRAGIQSQPPYLISLRRQPLSPSS